MPTAMERKSLFARRDLVEKLMEIASKMGVSLYNLVNEIFEQYIEAWKAGVNLSGETLMCVRAVERARKAGLVLVPESLLIKVLANIPENTYHALFEVGRETGAWLVKYYKTYGSVNPLADFIGDLRRIGLFPGDLTVSEDRGVIVIRVANPRMHSTYAKLLASILLGFLSEAGYSIHSTEIREGLIVVHAVRGGKRE